MCASVDVATYTSSATVPDASAPTAAASTTKPASAKTISSARSLLHRLTAPLKRPRQRNLTDFHIEPLEPHRQYSPGDLVKGAVVLTVAKPIRVTHVTVCLHGLVRVHKTAGGSNELPSLQETSSQSRKSQYLGNGHASLFQDEVSLCGEGRLEPGVYKFNFELEFPSQGLPTSIDFERGTIAYMLTATITRPTSIAATSTCDTKLSLVETVDIGPLLPHKPRVITLEPITKRSKSKRRSTKSSTSLITSTETPAPHGGSTVTVPIPEDTLSSIGSLDGQAKLHSPASSDVHSSTDSTCSSGNRVSFRVAPVPPSTTSPRNSRAPSSKCSIQAKTITANIELTKAGCLPGDTLIVKLNVSHVKPIKSLHGVIVTFYRQGRIDTNPPLELFGDLNDEALQNLKHDEYYPKSKTGLGGLSLTSAGSSSVFRKDLSQIFAPFIVDPSTLTTTVSASIRVPEDVFPTISGVPGSMISFHYFVEVVVDLGGKLAGQQRHLPRLGTLPVPTAYTGKVDGSTSMLAATSGNTVDTDHIRRERGIVACVFNVTVGSIDSQRARAAKASLPDQRTNDHHADGLTPTQSRHQIGRNNHSESELDTTHDASYTEAFPYEYGAGYGDSYYNQHYTYEPPPVHDFVPPPEVTNEQHLTDKERARLAEQRLLPSQPPEDNAGAGPSRAQDSQLVPSAPSILPVVEEDLYNDDDITSIEQSARPGASAGQVQSLPFMPPQPLSHASTRSSPRRSTMKDLSSPPEDKQELERRRLMVDASTPFEPPDSAGEGLSPAPEHDAHAPSAPILDESDPFGAPWTRHNGDVASVVTESLPKYQR